MIFQPGRAILAGWCVRRRRETTRPSAILQPVQQEGATRPLAPFTSRQPLRCWSSWISARTASRPTLANEPVTGRLQDRRDAHSRSHRADMGRRRRAIRRPPVDQSSDAESSPLTAGEPLIASSDSKMTTDADAKLQQRDRSEHGEAFDRLMGTARERLYSVDPEDEKATAAPSITRKPLQVTAFRLAHRSRRGRRRPHSLRCPKCASYGRRRGRRASPWGAVCDRSSRRGAASRSGVVAASGSTR